MNKFVAGFLFLTVLLVGCSHSETTQDEKSAGLLGAAEGAAPASPIDPVQSEAIDGPGSYTGSWRPESAPLAVETVRKHKKSRHSKKRLAGRRKDKRKGLARRNRQRE